MSGRVLGFGGNTQMIKKAKYLNSPESDIYHKSKVLYGIFFQTITLPSKTIVLVEELHDVIQFNNLE
jgi:DNA primase